MQGGGFRTSFFAARFLLAQKWALFWHAIQAKPECAHFGQRPKLGSQKTGCKKTWKKTQLIVVQSLRNVNKAVLGQRSNFFAIIKKFNPEKIALGHDQWPGRERLQKYLYENGIPAKIVRLPAFKAHIFKSTRIKNRIKTAFLRKKAGEKRNNG